MACSCKKRGLCPSCGGGTRAAALAYGVLEALAAIRVPYPQPHRLLDEVK